MYYHDNESKAQTRIVASICEDKINCIINEYFLLKEECFPFIFLDRMYIK